MTEEELKCTRTRRQEKHECLTNCQGMNIVSYNVQELEPKWTKNLKRPSSILKTKFLNNPKQTKFILKLSDEYNKFKKSYNFPTKYNSKFNET